MKFKTIIITIFILFSVHVSQAQLDCEALKKENKMLKAQLGIGLNNPETKIKSFSDLIDIKITSVKGSPDEQTVKINFLISHEQVHKEIQIDVSYSKAYDFKGNELSAKNAGIGEKSGRYSISNKVPTNIPIKAFVTIKNVLPSTEIFKLVSIRFEHKNYDSDNFTNRTKGNLEINNLKID